MTRRLARWGLLCLGVLAGALVAATLALATTSLTADPTSLTFTQDVDEGTSSAQPVTIRNTDSTNSATIQSIGIDNSAFAVDPQPGDCSSAVPTVLGPDETCTVHVTFTPPGTGDQSGTLTVQSSGGDATVDLTGTGTQTAWSADKSSLDLGSQDIDEGASVPKTVTITNDGTEPITLAGIDITGTDAADFQQQPGANECGTSGPAATLNGGASCDVTIVFDPSTITPPGKSATLTVSSSTAGVPDLTVDLTGQATDTKLSATPPSVSFGSQDVDAGPTTSPKSTTISNDGTEPIHFTSITFPAEFPQDPQPGECSQTQDLTAGQSCQLDVEFDPSARGMRSGDIAIATSTAGTLNVGASGTGVAKRLTADPTSEAFGSQEVGSASSTRTSVVTNTGDLPVDVTGATVGGANPHQFKLLTDAPTTDCSSVGTLAVGDHCDVRVQFQPTSRGAKAATVTVTSNAPAATVDLSGTGTQSVYRQSDQPIPGGYVTNGQVNAVGYDAAGRAYLGGTFTSIGPRTGHGAKLSTTSDQPASSFPDVDGSVRAVAPDGSGGWFIGGDFSTVGGLARARLAHIQSSGAVDLNWNPGSDGRVNAIAVSGTAVYVGGEFTTVGGQPRAFMARLSKTNGDVTTSWDASLNGRVTALAATAAGIYVGGDFTQIAGAPRNRLALIHDQTVADADEFWDPNADGNVAAIAVSADSVYVGGSFTGVGGSARNRLAKLDLTTGSADLSWNPGASGGSVSALALSGSDLYAGGSFTTIDSQPRNRIAKLDGASGAVDAGWNPDANNTVLALVATGSDVYAAGDFTQIGAVSRNRLAKLAASDGSLDAWNPNANATGRSIAISGTDVYAGGDFTSLGGQTRNRLARVDPDGSVDDWNPDASGTVSALVVSGSDVYVGGAFTTVGGQPRNRIAKLSTDTGSADLTWNPDSTGTVSSLAVSGTDVYAGGLFLHIGGQDRMRIAELTGASGSADPGWHPEANGQVSALAAVGSDLYAAGSFTTIGGQPRDRIARISSITGAADTWDPDANNTVSALAVSGSNVYAGGSFTSIGRQSRNFVAKLSTAGAGDADFAWNPGANSVVRALALSAGDVYMGGDFTAVTGQPHGRLAKAPQTGDGTADAGWDPGANNTVLGLAIQGDRLAAGGAFTAIGGQSSAGFALLEVPALSPSPGGLAFGNREVSAAPSSPMESTVTNSGSQAVHINAVTLVGPDASQFSRESGLGTDCAAGMDLAPGSTCKVRAEFDPSSAGAKSAEIAIDSNSPGVSVALTGTGTTSALSPSPTNIDFGSKDRDAGATAEMQSVVTNSGTQTITLSEVAIGGTNAGDFHRQGDNPLDCRGPADDPDPGGPPGAMQAATQLIPGQSCNVRVTFDPSAVDARSAKVTVTPTVGDPVDIGLSGTGTLTQITRSPASIDFGNQDIDGTSSPMSSVVTNSGTEPVTISGVSIPGSDFEQVATQTSDCTAGKTLARAATCDVRVVFHPGTTGAKSGTATISSSTAGVGDLTVGLAGQGTQTQLTPASASLTFDPQELTAPASTTKTATFTNTGTERVTVNSADVTGNSADFVHLTDQTTDCKAGKQIDPTGTCEVRLQFDPATRGARQATVTVTSNADDVVVNASGTATDTRLSATPNNHDFGKQDIDVTPSAYFESTVKNDGDQNVDITGVTSSDPTQFPVVADGPTTNCTSVTHLAPNEECKVRVKFDPSSTGHKTATVTVASNAPDVTIDVMGDGTQTELSTDRSSIDFGNQFVGGGPTGEQTAKITNTGTETVNLTGVTLDGDSGQFTRATSASSDCSSSTTLAAGEFCNVRVRFDPDSTGDKASTVHVTSNAPEVTVGLSGHGTLAQLGRSDATLAFADRDIDEANASAPMTSTITNTGNVDVTITSVSFDPGGTDPGAFAHPTDDPGDCTGSTVLHPLGQCTVRATFHPTTTGDKSASLTVHSNASDVTVGLTGRGTQTAWSRSPASVPLGKQDIDDGASGAQQATVTNDGTEPIVISGVSSDDPQFVVQSGDSGDCTSKSPLAHGDSCSVRVKFDPSSTGAKSATITVATTTGGISSLTFAVTGEGTQTAWSRSPASVSLGKQDIDDGASGAQQATVTNDGTEPIVISGVTSDDPQFVVQSGDSGDCTSSSPLAHGASCSVRVKFDPSSIGAKSGTVTVATATGGISSLTFGVTGEGTQTAWSRTPASVSLGKQNIDGGASGVQHATVTNDGTEPIAISGASSDDPQFVVQSGDSGDCTSSSPLAHGASCSVRVTFDPSSTGAKSATVTVATATGGISSLTFGVTGEGTQAVLSRAPASLSFGGKGVDEGPTGARTSVVTNSGSEDVTLTGVDVTGDFAQATGQPDDCFTGKALLHVGDTCNLRVRFDPAATGSRTGTATVHSNAADVSAALSGTGTATDLSPSPAALAFGKRDVDDGPTGALRTTITNASPDAVTVGTIGISGSNAGEFELLTGLPGDCVENQVLAPAESCGVHARFDPAATGARSATLNVPASGGATATVDLTGSGAQTGVTRNVASISAGSQDVDDGPTTPQAATVTNVGTEDVTVSSIDVTGEFSQAAVQSGDCSPGRLLHAGDACSLRVQFDPSSIGGKSGTATVHSNAADVSVALDGRGVQTSLSHDPTALDFGSHEVGSGTTAAMESTIRNTGTQPVTLTDVRVDQSGATQFVRVSGAPTDCTPGATLNAGDSCKLRAAFVPQSAGTGSAKMTLSSTAGVATVALSGTATPRPALRIPTFTARASSTKNRRLTVNVTPVAGTIRNIVVQVKSRSGKVLGTGTLASAARKRAVTVKLKSALTPGTYRAVGTGRDALRRTVTARTDFKLR